MKSWTLGYTSEQKKDVKQSYRDGYIGETITSWSFGGSFSMVTGVRLAVSWAPCWLANLNNFPRIRTKNCPQLCSTGPHGNEGRVGEPNQGLWLDCDLHLLFKKGTGQFLIKALDLSQDTIKHTHTQSYPTQLF